PIVKEGSPIPGREGDGAYRLSGSPTPASLPPPRECGRDHLGTVEQLLPAGHGEAVPPAAMYDRVVLLRQLLLCKARHHFGHGRRDDGDKILMQGVGDILRAHGCCLQIRPAISLTGLSKELTTLHPNARRYAKSAC